MKWKSRIGYCGRNNLDSRLRGNDTGTVTVASARILVVKIGSSLLVEEATGDIQRAWLDALADDVSA